MYIAAVEHKMLHIITATLRKWKHSFVYIDTK